MGLAPPSLLCYIPDCFENVGSKKFSYFFNNVWNKSKKLKRILKILLKYSIKSICTSLLPSFAANKPHNSEIIGNAWENNYWKS